MAALSMASGFGRPDDIADCIEAALHLDRHDRTSFKRYAKGVQFPVKGDHPYACGEWVTLAARVWPGTDAWFRTPFWFLLKNKEVSPRDLMTCARGLPYLFREDLLEPDSPNAPAALHMTPVPRDFLYVFTAPLNPWSLGALACAMRRAELAAEVGSMRWSAVGLVWAVGRFMESANPVMHKPLEELRYLVTKLFGGLVYPGQHHIRAEITDADVDRFGREQKKYVDYFTECDFSGFRIDEPPPWRSISTV